jgi:hypothetical protein
MAVYVTVPVSTEVIEANPDCPISGAYENGVLRLTLDTRHQNHHQRLGLGTKSPELGLRFHTFYIDGCRAYFNAIRAVFGPAVQIQYGVHYLPLKSEYRCSA